MHPERGWAQDVHGRAQAVERFEELLGAPCRDAAALRARLQSDGQAIPDGIGSGDAGLLGVRVDVADRCGSRRALTHFRDSSSVGACGRVCARGPACLRVFSVARAVLLGVVCALVHRLQEALEQPFDVHPGAACGAREAVPGERTELIPEPDLQVASTPELWAHMQHHGCPTRLLDWTASAYVAAYFAVDKCEDRDGALFMVAGAAVGDARIPDEDLIDPAVPERVMFTWPQFKSRRVVAQQGHFSVSSKVSAAHDGPILDACLRTSTEHPDAVIHRQIIIGADLKLVVLQQLRAMNIAPHALFPGLDGLGRSLADLARLAAVLARPPNRA